MLCKKKIIKVFQVKHKKGEGQRLYPMRKKFKKSELLQTRPQASTLFGNKQGLTIGACHDVGDLSHDNPLLTFCILVQL